MSLTVPLAGQVLGASVLPFCAVAPVLLLRSGYSLLHISRKHILGEAQDCGSNQGR